MPRKKPTEQQRAASDFISETLINCHEEVNELYDYLHPNGNPIEQVDGAVDNKLKKFMTAMKENMAGIREYFKD